MGHESIDNGGKKVKLPPAAETELSQNKSNNTERIFAILMPFILAFWLNFLIRKLLKRRMIF